MSCGGWYLSGKVRLAYSNKMVQQEGRVNHTAAHAVALVVGQIERGVRVAGACVNFDQLRRVVVVPRRHAIARQLVCISSTPQLSLVATYKHPAEHR